MAKGQTVVAERAACLVPIATERRGEQAVRQAAREVAVDAFARMGTLLADSIRDELVEPAEIDGHTLPVVLDGRTELPACAYWRFTAWVVPNADELRRRAATDNGGVDG